MNQIKRFFKQKYPRSYIIENSVAGAVIITFFCFGFLILYKPLNAHASKSLSYGATMAIYSLVSGLTVIGTVKILFLIRWFNEVKKWNVLKEILSVFLIISSIGTVIYLIGFLIEPPGNRMNIETYLNSVKSAFLLSFIPFAFFSSINYRFLISDEKPGLPAIQVNDPNLEEIIRISSQLKKEEVKFYPSEFLYAESDGNYVVFFLKKNNQLKKEIIRNSISSIEQQLAVVPWFVRTHRAFIVNLKMIKSKQGNILGYQLKLDDTDFIIPVSRNNISIFDKQYQQFHS